MHYFITTFFNYCNYQIKELLAQDFMDKYGHIVHLLECVYNNDEPVINHDNKTIYRTHRHAYFIDYIMINQFIKNHNDIETLTLIDSDLELPDNFFTNVIYKHSEYLNVPVAIQCYSNARQLNAPHDVMQIYPSIIKNNIEKINSQGHSGYVWSFNRHFLQLLQNCMFPECFSIGGFDYILAMALLKRIRVLLTLVDNQQFTNKLIDFYYSIQTAHYDYLDTNIAHYWHGFPGRRYHGMWKLYESINQDVIDDYFHSRQENAT
jgi:hypothetical protein